MMPRLMPTATHRSGPLVHGRRFEGSPGGSHVSWSALWAAVQTVWPGVSTILPGPPSTFSSRVAMVLSRSAMTRST